MSGSSSKRKERSHDKESINTNTKLALNGLIDNIVLLVRESGYTIYLDKTEISSDNFKFYIENPQKSPLKPILISSVSIVLHGETILLKTPRTRSRKKRQVDTFYIEDVFTHNDHRRKGWATLLLIYALSNLQLTHHNVKIFILNDESIQSNDMLNNVYNRLGFSYIHLESMNTNHFH